MSQAMRQETAATAQLRDAIVAFEPFNEQEAADKQVILQALDNHGLVDAVHAGVERQAAVDQRLHDRHVVGEDRVLHGEETDHGGLVVTVDDGELDLEAVALRELQEETGVENARIVPVSPGNIYSLEVLTVNGHEKHGAYVSSHLHLNITYLAIADPSEHTRIKPDENSGVRWVPIEDAIRLSTEPWIRERIYRKLIDKLDHVKL